MKKILLGAVPLLAAYLVFGNARSASAQVPGVNISLNLSATVISYANMAWHTWPNFAYTSSATIYPGGTVDIRQNTVLTAADGIRGYIDGTPYNNTVLHWVASNCPPGSTCLQWNYRESNPMIFPWWGVLVNAPYTDTSAPMLSVQTSASTPPGSYQIPFTVEENPTTASQFGNMLTPVTKTFTIIVAQPPQPTANIKANGSDGPITVTPGANSVLLSWSSTNSGSCSVSPGGSSGTSGAVNVNVTQTVTYTVSCSGTAGGTATDSVTINYAAQAPSATIFANGTRPSLTIPYNTSANITWTSQNATSCSVSPTGWTGTSNSTGMSTGNLTAPKTYTLNCTGPGGSASDGVTVNVQGVAPAVDIKINGSDGPVSISPGQPVTVSWSSSQSAQSCSVAPIGASGTSGSQVDSDTYQSKTYAIQCYGSWGANAISDTAQLNVTTVQPPAVSLSASPQTVSAGGASTLSWSVSGQATSCTASGGWNGSKSVSGGSQSTGSIYIPTTYTLSCTGSGGTDTKSVTVSVSGGTPTVSITANGAGGSTTVSSGGSATISWTSQNATSCSVSPTGHTGTNGSFTEGGITSSRTYTVSCGGPGGSASDSVTVNVGTPPPIPDIKANASDGPITVPSGGSATISWTSQNATSCSVSPTGQSGTAGSFTASNITSSRTYAVSCSGPGGSASDSVTVNVGAARAIMGIDKPLLVFSAGTANPVPPPRQQILVYNSGTAPLYWTTSSNQPWCHINPPSGTLRQTDGVFLDVTVDAPSNTGTFNCSIVISDPAAQGSPQTVSVVYNVSSDGRADIYLAPPTVSFIGSVGGPTPPAQQVTLYNTGLDFLRWSAQTDQSWCHVSPGSGTVTAGESTVLNISVDAPSNLGTFYCGVKVTAPNANNSGRTVSVTYSVGSGPRGTIKLSPSYFTFSSSYNGPTPAPRTVTFQNVGAKTLNWTTSTNRPWCHLSPGSGTLAVNGSLNLTLSVDAPSNPGTFDCTAYVSDPDANNSPQTVSAVYTVSALPKAAISLTPASLDFNGYAGGSAPPPQQVALTNTGGSPLAWQAVPGENWCQVSPASGSLAAGASAVLQVSVSQPSNIGTFTCGIQVQDPQASNSPQPITVRYAVSSIPKPAVSLSPTSLYFRAPVGGPAPAAQSITLRNTGYAPLNWNALTNQGWCRVTPTSGSLGQGSQTTLSVSVTALSTVGNYSCTLTVRDAGDPTIQRAISIVYSSGTSSAGDPGNVTASTPTCGAVRLSWTAGSGAFAYNIYRSITPTVSGSPYGYVYGATTYTDSSLSAGSRYYYWVESVGGNGTKVPANSNAQGGITASVCQTPPLAPSNLIVSVATCGQAYLTWGNVVGEDGFFIYRSDVQKATPDTADRITQLEADVTTLVSPAQAGTYYYWVSSFNTFGESVPKLALGAPHRVEACQADLSASDKNIRSVNGIPQANTDCDFDKFQGLPETTTSLRTGDTVVFEVNLCNQSRSTDATQVLVANYLTNFASPDNGWNAKIDGQTLTYVGSNLTPDVGQYAYDASQRRLLFNVGTVAKNSAKQITYDAQIKTDPNYQSICPRCENKAVVNYLKDASTLGSLELHVPGIFYSIK